MAKSKLILIVDDDKDIRRLIKVALSKKREFKTICVKNGREALELLKTTSPQAIILDIVMPDMDGYTFLRQIKRTPELERIPVIISSAKNGLKEYFDLEDEKLRPDAFLIKPYKMKDLINTVKQMV